MDQTQLENLFSYHPPKGNQPARYQEIRDAGAALAQIILINTPACADQALAINKVREAIMFANASIACNE